MLKKIEHSRNILLVFSLITILCLGVFFRFYNLRNEGLLLSDCAFQFREAKTIASLAKWTLTKSCGIQKLSLGEYLAIYGDAIPSLPKEGFLTFASLSLFIFGAKDYVILAVSAFFGTLTVILVYLIGKSLYDKITGVLAALILALSPYHVVYSRTGLSHITATFFLFLGFYFYILSSLKNNASINKKIVLAGFSIGYAFTCHYALYPIFGLFLIFELLNREITGKDKIKRLFIFYAFALIPIFCFQIITFFSKEMIIRYSKIWILNPYISANKDKLFMTYFQQIKSLFEGNLGPGKGTKQDIFFYPFCIWYYEGFLESILLSLGVLILTLRQIRKFARADFMIVVFFVYILLGYTIPNVKAARMLIIITPLIAIIVARTLMIIIKYLNCLHRPLLGRFIVVMATIFILRNGFFNSKNGLSQMAGYKQAMEFIAKSGNIAYIYMTTDSNLSSTEAYVDKEKFKNHMRFSFESLEQAERLYKKYEVRYVILDQFKYYFPSELVSRIESTEPVFKTFHSTDAFLYDDAHFYKGVINKIKNGPRELRIYDLKNILDKEA